jgi:hypothetical protein
MIIGCQNVTKVSIRKSQYWQFSSILHDGIYTNTLWLPRYSESGAWSLTAIQLADAVGNLQRIDLISALVRGLPTQFLVLGESDITPPEILSLDFSPRRINSASEQQSLRFTVRIRDDKSGMGNPISSYASLGAATVSFASPSKNQMLRVTFSSQNLVSGDNLDGVYSNSMLLPRYPESGIWTLSTFQLIDAAGNSVNLDTGNVRLLGFPTQFAVGIAPTLKVFRSANSILLAWPNWSSDFRLESCRQFPQSNWETVDIPAVSIGDDCLVAAPLSLDQSYYRLSYPSDSPTAPR